jgi:hypothetical protein
MRPKVRTLLLHISSIEIIKTGTNNIQASLTHLDWIAIVTLDRIGDDIHPYEKKIEKRSLTWMSPEMAGVKRRWRRCVDGRGHAEMAATFTGGGVTRRWQGSRGDGGAALMAGVTRRWRRRSPTREDRDGG